MELEMQQLPQMRLIVDQVIIAELLLSLYLQTHLHQQILELMWLHLLLQILMVMFQCVMLQ